MPQPNDKKPVLPDPNGISLTLRCLGQKLQEILRHVPRRLREWYLAVHWHDWRRSVQAVFSGAAHRLS